MDHLDELPQAQTNLTPYEDAVLNEIFGPSIQAHSGSSRFARIEWKFLGTVVVLFVILANPWIDNILCHVPYCGGGKISSLLVKTLIFAVILALLFMFM